jgi:hypothetical protein
MKRVRLAKKYLRPANTQFPFSDLNSLEIADLLSKFLTEKGLE